VKFGEGLKGKNLTLYLVVEASDGYRVVYALPELDPAYTDKVVMVVDKRDGKALIVVQDLDKSNFVGSYWGEVNANVRRALGCVGSINATRPLNDREDLRKLPCNEETLSNSPAWASRQARWPIRWPCAPKPRRSAIRPKPRPRRARL
jgi:hypothetical protein